VDVLFGLPYILLVVLLAVASDAAVRQYISRSKPRVAWVEAQAERLRSDFDLAAPDLERPPPPGSPLQGALLELWRSGEPIDPEASVQTVLEQAAIGRYPPRTISEGRRMAIDVIILLVAIGGVSWLTMARVIRGQVLSLKHQPFLEAARAMGAPARRQFARHLLPNLLGPIIVYATLTVPLAILQESFLSFLGIGVKPPLPSWGNLAADGLVELNPYKSHWWLLLFPCLMLGSTLLALNFVGEGLREAFDPKRARR
ncbi:MAG: ABC transporter permease, partial [Phycisphaerales bacterium JB039]